MDFSMVLPGQFPTCWRERVKALNNVLFPVLGLPANATENRLSDSAL
jgi:hypothetical protein